MSRSSVTSDDELSVDEESEIAAEEPAMKDDELKEDFKRKLPYPVTYQHTISFLVPVTGAVPSF